MSYEQDMLACAEKHLELANAEMVESLRLRGQKACKLRLKPTN